MSDEMLIFTKRPPRDKYQVRFWSNRDLYVEFTIWCEKNGLVIQDVFETFMERFIKAGREGKIIVKDKHE